VPAVVRRRSASSRKNSAGDGVRRLDHGPDTRESASSSGFLAAMVTPVRRCRRASRGNFETHGSLTANDSTRLRSSGVNAGPPFRLATIIAPSIGCDVQGTINAGPRFPSCSTADTLEHHLPRRRGDGPTCREDLASQ